MEVDKVHLRHCILFVFQLQKNAAAVTEMICSALGKSTVIHKTCKKWYQRFRDGNFDLLVTENIQASLNNLMTINCSSYWIRTLLKLNKSLLHNLESHNKSFLFNCIEWEKFRRRMDSTYEFTED
ncbi:histone-lysine n-methyltransferase setmar [Lasius niger]|uniref:Histone-lysine n-methyltransferase setmar n=1 Tax=Lasius niger TaxID=67767 RepID=A0A0J7KEV5_LASNI|nr:histone-lysine n-methyltransferase setmar [Lasius niger]